MSLYRALYEDGALVPPKKGQSADPKPTAGNDGTTITIEDLFHNIPTRLMALRNSSEEYTRILDVVTRYAIHNPTVSFVCKKAGQSVADISSPGGNVSERDVIKLLYGGNIARELMNLQAPDQILEQSNSDAGVTLLHSSHLLVDDAEKMRMKWRWIILFLKNLLGNARHSSAVRISKGRKLPSCYLLIVSYLNVHYPFIYRSLQILDRLVDSPRLKKACDNVYTAILPKGSFPFLYIGLDIIPQNVDVNVHPTKREVHFINEEEIIEAIASKMTEVLASKAQSRTFEYQALLTGGVTDDSSKYRKDGSGMKGGSSQKVYSHHKVRNSQQDRTLESMFPVTHPATQAAANDSEGEVGDTDDEPQVFEEDKSLSKIRDVPESECYLTSVINLREEVKAQRHNRLSEIISKHVFVGIVDLSKCLSLIQHSTKLYLVNHAALAEEFFYQMGLRQFGDFKRLKLEPPPNVRELIELAVGVEEGVKKAGLDVDSVTGSITGILISRRDMLNEYFSLNIDDDGRLTSIPMLMRDYTPNLEKLPLLLMRLGPQVNWTSEKECFQTILSELAFFYNPTSLSQRHPSHEKDSDGEKAERWQLQHVLFPAMMKYFVAPKSLLDRDVVQIANLPDLYRVFERC